MIKSKERLKKKEIRKALNSNPVDIPQLRKLSMSYGGLINSELRRRVWPHLLGVADKFVDVDDDFDYKSSKDYNQVKLDVDRCHSNFPASFPMSKRPQAQEELLKLIINVLHLNPTLNYYQGYHDVAITLLLVCGPTEALPALEVLSTHHLRDFMDPTMDSTCHILNYLRPILHRLNPELVEFITKAEVEMTFAISWLITWYSHVLKSHSNISRLFDFFLSCHPLMPVYFAAHLVNHNAPNILQSQCEMPYVYKSLLQSPSEHFPLEHLVSQTCAFFVQFPPSSLRVSLEGAKEDNLAVSAFHDYRLVALQGDPRRNERREENVVEEKSATRWGRLRRVGLATGGIVGTIALAATGVIIENAPTIAKFLFG